jgi:hypothetical protein
VPPRFYRREVCEERTTATPRHAPSRTNATCAQRTFAHIASTIGEASALRPVEARLNERIVVVVLRGGREDERVRSAAETTRRTRPMRREDSQCRRLSQSCSETRRAPALNEIKRSSDTHASHLEASQRDTRTQGVHEVDRRRGDGKAAQARELAHAREKIAQRHRARIVKLVARDVAVGGGGE